MPEQCAHGELATVVPSPRQCEHRANVPNRGRGSAWLSPACRRWISHPHQSASRHCGEDKVPGAGEQTGQPPGRSAGLLRASSSLTSAARAPSAGETDQPYRARVTQSRLSNRSGYGLVTRGYGAGLVFTNEIASLGQSDSSSSRMGGWCLQLGRRGSVGPTVFLEHAVAVPRAPGRWGRFSAPVYAACARAQQQWARSDVVHEIAVPPSLRLARPGKRRGKFRHQTPRKPAMITTVTSSGHRRPRCRRVALEGIHCA